MTATLIAFGLFLAPPTGWLLGRLAGRLDLRDFLKIEAQAGRGVGRRLMKSEMNSRLAPKSKCLQKPCLLLIVERGKERTKRRLDRGVA